VTAVTTQSPVVPAKPLGMKSYGSIGHLPGSRVGPGDHSVSPGQARIATERVRDKHDHVVVQEKVDGSCCAAVNLDGMIVALGRAGYTARSSSYELHWLFADWVDLHHEQFRKLLEPGERAVGEWLAMAHGTRYALPHEPFVIFDLMREHERAVASEVYRRVGEIELPTPRLLSNGPSFSIEAAVALLADSSFHGAIDPTEGAVWRLERQGKVDFLCKWVRPEKVDGLYFVEPLTWNWRPE